MKLSNALIAAAVAGSISITAFAPALAANDQRGKGPRDDRMEHNMRGNGAGMAGGFVHLMCSEDGAERLETALGNISERIELTEEQKALYDTFKTEALTAQTNFADSCTPIERPDPQSADAQSFDPIEALKQRNANMAAMASAMDEVIPSLEAFYDSLTDEQKGQLKPKRGFRDMRSDRNDRNDRGFNHGPRR